MNRGIGNNLLAVIMAASLGLVLGACGETTKRAPDPRFPAPQETTATTTTPTPTATFQPETVSPQPVGSTEFASQTGTGTLDIRYAWHRQGAKADSVPPTKAYLVVTVKISCSTGTCYHNPAAFRVQEPGGAAVNFTGGKDGYGPILGTGTLQANANTSGVVTFDTARDDVTLEFLDEFDQVSASTDITG